MECDEKIGARIRQFMDDCDTFYEQGQLSKARDSLFEAWGILPDEKYIYDESYWIVAFILDLSIELHDMDTILTHITFFYFLQKTINLFETDRQDNDKIYFGWNSEYTCWYRCYVFDV